MRDLGLVNDGAVLVHNGVVRHVGPSRRVENLAEAKGAKVIDASGKVVMPSFVDPAAVLVHPALGRRPGSGEPSLRTVSTQVLEGRAIAAASDWVRHGVLSVGAHTGYASELREVMKVLRVCKALQGKPLRIRSVFACRIFGETGAGRAELLEQVVSKWLPAIRESKMASIAEFTVDDDDEAGYDAGFANVLGSEGVRTAARAAAGLGFSLHIRSTKPVGSEALRLAQESGAFATLGPGIYRAEDLPPGCMHVLPVGCDYEGSPYFPMRDALDAGCPVAICSGHPPTGFSSLNPQFLLYAATARHGFSEEEGICAATWNAACALRMSQVAGSIEPEKAADIVVLDVPDYRELARRGGQHDTWMVLRAGQVAYKRGSLNHGRSSKANP